MTDEHIIPFALGGNVILPKASCKACARETGAIVEHQVLRRQFGLVRAQRAMPTRRPKERPKTHRVTLDYGTHKETIEEDLRYRPLTFGMLMFPLPSILMDLPADESGTMKGAKRLRIRVEDPHNPFERHPAAQKLTIYDEFNPLLFARMLAKIAHSFAIAEYGFGSFPPLLGPLILGKRNGTHFQDVVGGCLEIIPKWPGPMSVGRLIRLNTLHYHLEYLVAEIRLFADLGAPIYWIVCGLSGGLGLPLRVQQEPP